MSLSVLINSAVKEAGLDDNEFGKAAEAAVVTALKETPLRVEVFEKAAPKVMDALSIADVHTVLDALIEVLEGK